MFTRRQLFFNHVAQTSPSPPAIEIARAEGVYVYDSAGKKYIDFISGIAVSSLGHGNPEIIKAIKKQLDQHLHIMVYGEHVLSPQVDLANEITSHLPDNLQSVFFTNSGTEATEGAMKLAKRFTGRTEIISFKNSYHGSSQGSLSICGNEDLKNAFRPLIPGNRLLDYNSFDDLTFITEKTAAVFVEPVQAEAGIILPKENFLQQLRKRCTEKNVLLVFDEIQTGMGRTGSLFAFTQFDVVPDILLLGKALGGGMPLGAFISSNDIMSSLTHHPALGHLTTSGGHPVCCAAALASLRILTSTDLINQVANKEKILRESFKDSLIKSFRGIGLLCALEFNSEEMNQKVAAMCMENGLLTDWFLFSPSSLRIAPPLIITHEELKTSCEIIMEAIRLVS